MKFRASRVLMFFLVMAIFIGFASLPSTSSPISAQGPSTAAPTQAATQSAAETGCADFINAALTATTQACAATGNNQACYGSISIKAEGQPGAPEFSFDAPGKIVDLVAIKSLQMSALDPDTKTWGVALMRLRANLPGTSAGQFATMLIFGDVHLENAVAAPSKTLSLAATANTNIVSKPQTGTLVARLTAQDSVLVIGRLQDNSWLRVQVTPKGGQTTLIGWVQAKSLEASTDVATLDVVDPAAPVYGPMQAFYFQTGINAQTCKAAPPNGILIQTPKNAPKVNLVINNAKVSIGSTVFMDSSDDMTLSTFEGAATVESQGKQVSVPKGLQVALPLGSDHKVSGPPENPQPIKLVDYSTLPTNILPDPVNMISTPQPKAATPSQQRTAQPGGQRTGFICPSGATVRFSYPTQNLNGQVIPGRTGVTGCTCNTGTHTITSPTPGGNATIEVCN